MSTCAKSGLGACGDAGSRARLPGIAPGSRFVRACWAVVREGSRSAAPHPPPEKTGPSEWPRWMALHSDGRLRTAWPITSEQKSESAERLHATVGGPPALLLRSKWPTQQCLNNQPLRAWGRSSAPSLELALRLGWASLRPDPSSGMRVPWHLLPLDRRAARSSRRSLGVDHMAISGPRLLLLLAFMLTLISVTPPALDRLPWQGRRRTNKCRCAAMVSRGTQTALPAPKAHTVACRRSVASVANSRRCCCSRGVRAGWAMTRAATVMVGIPFLGRTKQQGALSTGPDR